MNSYPIHFKFVEYHYAINPKYPILFKLWSKYAIDAKPYLFP